MNPQTFIDNLEAFNEHLLSHGLESATELDVQDWGLGEELDENEIWEIACDWISEAHTTRCENNNSWRYNL